MVGAPSQALRAPPSRIESNLCDWQDVIFLSVLLGASFMGRVSKRKREVIEKPTPKWPATLDELLDEALGETFPASDAVSLIQPKDHADSGKS